MATKKSSKPKYGFIDKSGNIVIPLEYDSVEHFSEGLAKVKKDGKDGFIDKCGKIVVPLEYKGADDFHEGLARIRKDGNYGFLDKSGKVVVPFVYDGADYFREGLVMVKKDGKYGFIDKSGKVVVPLVYDGAYFFSEGLVMVENAGKYGFVDKSGKIVVPLEYDYANNFSEGLAAVCAPQKNESEKKKSGKKSTAENETIDVHLFIDCTVFEAEAIELNDDEIAEAEKNEDFEIDMEDDERYSGYTFGFVDGDSLRVDYTIIRDGEEEEQPYLKLKKGNYKMDPQEESLMKELGIESRKGYLRLWDGRGSVTADIKGIKEFDPKKLKILTSKYVEKFNGKTVIECVSMDGIEYDGVDIEWDMDSDAMSGYNEYVVDVPTSDKK